MENFEIEDIWNDGFRSKNLRESVESIALKHKEKSLNIVDRIKRTARIEHRVFLIIIMVAIPVLLYFNLYLWVSVLAVFTFLAIVLYEYQIRKINQVVFQRNTLNYLLSVKKVLDMLRYNFKIGFSIITPLSYAVGMYFGISKANKSLADLFDKPIFWFALVIGSIVSVVVFRFWFYFWVKTFYGKKLQELEDMIAELKNT